MIYGYARVSTADQLLEVQIEQLKKAGVIEKNIYKEKITGVANLEERKALKRLLNVVKVGDEILITKLDRLGRNSFEMHKLIKELNEKGVFITSLEQGISTKGTTGKLVISILTAVAEMERERILERTSEGRELAKIKGIKFGRKRKLNYVAIQEEKRNGASNKKIAEKFKISLSHLHYILKSKCI